MTSIVADKSTLYTVSGESSVVEAWSTFDGTLLWSELLNVGRYCFFLLNVVG